MKPTKIHLNKRDVTRLRYLAHRLRRSRTPYALAILALNRSRDGMTVWLNETQAKALLGLLFGYGVRS